MPCRGPGIDTSCGRPVRVPTTVGLGVGRSGLLLGLPVVTDLLVGVLQGTELDHTEPCAALRSTTVRRPRADQRHRPDEDQQAASMFRAARAVGLNAANTAARIIDPRPRRTASVVLGRRASCGVVPGVLTIIRIIEVIAG